jgi:hypothetical protein
MKFGYFPKKQDSSGFFENPLFRHFWRHAIFGNPKVGKMPKKNRFFRFTTKNRVSLHDFDPNFEILEAYRAKLGPIFSVLLDPKKGRKNDSKPHFWSISLGFA